MINEIAFSKCEEPLIASSLWHSLTDAVRLEVGLSLRSPVFRVGVPTPNIIRLGADDVLECQTPDVAIQYSKGEKPVIYRYRRTISGKSHFLGSETVKVDPQDMHDNAAIIAMLESVRPEMKGRISIQPVGDQGKAPIVADGNALA
jgi:hypothetical protein